MNLIKGVLGFIIIILDKVLPALGVPDSFFVSLDGAISWFIVLLQSASYFLPLDIFVMCLTEMLIVDNFNLLMKIGRYIIELIRG